jgi:UDP-N-acetylglucosamine 2-epimerase (non-hydrolysing)
MRGVLRDFQPDRVLVHGDTTTTMAASLASFYERVPVGHVEAGLRTGNIYAPWPEEMNRKIAGSIADLHFAPTETARRNLLRENVPTGRIVVTGNTVIDALKFVVRKIQRSRPLQAALQEQFDFLDARRRLVLVTGHRRENFGEGFDSVCRALARLASRADVTVVYPVHLNPNVRKAVQGALTGVENVHLIEPLDYVPFVYLMQRACLILTDSGGVQEEAPALGKPVLVMRDVTERPEAVKAGVVRLVGTDEDKIVRQAGRLLDDRAAYRRMSTKVSPYGDGHAARRVVDAIRRDRTTAAT